MVFTTSLARSRPLRTLPRCSALFLATSARITSAKRSAPVLLLPSPFFMRSSCITMRTASLNRIFARSRGSETLRAAASPMYSASATSSTSSLPLAGMAPFDRPSKSIASGRGPGESLVRERVCRSLERPFGRPSYERNWVSGGRESRVLLLEEKVSCLVHRPFVTLNEPPFPPAWDLPAWSRDLPTCGLAFILAWKPTGSWASGTGGAVEGGWD
mmetsp:Transcript_11595/g.30000  ORF Transcript_11595/g.30000 Transcript_11595/m.30000 type:complete len:215 (+) Transcript_11595:689-1333(+)